MRTIITGAGGFIGSHLAKRLTADGNEVVGIDIKKNHHWPEKEFDSFFAHFQIGDLRDMRVPAELFLKYPADRIYHLAANMGGIGFIETAKGRIVRDNTLININTISSAADAIPYARFLFTSSACIYPGYKQRETNVKPLKETDAYPADAEDGYGWEKLYMERICRHYHEDFGFDTRVVRFHNVFGPHGTWDGGREKAPAAICRKVIQANDSIAIWGDGEQTRSFLYIDDCIEGLLAIMENSYQNPLNLGQDRMISINELVSMVETIGGKKLKRDYLLDAPKGVRGRNSDNTLLTATTGWRPEISLEEGLAKTYNWIADEIAAGRPGG